MASVRPHDEERACGTKPRFGVSLSSQPAQVSPAIAISQQKSKAASTEVLSAETSFAN